MNVKQWALFFLVTLSFNYVSATFLPISRHRGRSRGSGGYRWNNCNRRMYGYLRSNINDFRSNFKSKYGGQCSLGHNELDDFTLRNVRGRGFADFSLGDTCRYSVRDGLGYINFAISFEKIIASFVLGFPQAAGGIIGEFAEAIFGIIGNFVDKFLQIFFPSFLCNIILVTDSRRFRVHDFQIQRPEGGLGFLGGLAGHEDRLGSYLFEPLFSFISQFLEGTFLKFLRGGIGNWQCDDALLERLGLNLRGGSHRRILGGSRNRDGYDDSGEGGYEVSTSGRGSRNNRDGYDDSGEGGYEVSGRGSRNNRGRHSGRRGSGDGGYELTSGRGSRDTDSGYDESGDGGYGDSGDGGQTGSGYYRETSYYNDDNEEYDNEDDNEDEY